MKQKLLYLILIVFLIGLRSCKKNFLEVDDFGFLNRQGYVSDLKTLEEYTNGIYIQLSAYFEHGIGAAYPEVVADNLMPAPTGTQNLLPHYGWSQIPDDRTSYFEATASNAMNGSWKSAYFVIRACNFVLENADKYRAENIEKANNLKGQAYAIRALAHFKLVNIFAQTFDYTSNATHPGIPYITTSDVSAPFSRQTVGEVYVNLISDLNNAIQLLPANLEDTRRMNSLAAKALLSRIYLYSNDFSNAKQLASEVASQRPLMGIAAGYPNDMYKFKPIPTQTEVLFQITPINHSASGNISNFIGRYFRRSPVAFFATRDIATILRDYPTDVRVSWVKDTTISGGSYRLVKKIPVSATGTPALHTMAETDYYSPVIRSSEVFLIAAEASAKLGDENTAKTYLNTIRKRASSLIPDVTSGGTALLDSIYKERRKELCFEGFRMYDLQRWKMGVHRIDGLFSTIKDLPFPSAKAIAPLPIQDVMLAGLPQNPGY